MAWPLIAAMIAQGAQQTQGTIGGILSALTASTPTERTATQLPSSNPDNAAATFALMQMFGVPITGEVLLQASPLNQALNRRFATPVSRESRRRILEHSNRAVQFIADARANGDTRSTQEILDEGWGQITDGQERDAVLRAANEGGFTNVASLIDAELSYRQQVPQLVAAASQDASQNRSLHDLSLQQQQAALEALAQGSDITTLRGQERDSMLRDFEDQRQQALAAANASGSNPARALELLDKQRQDIDLTALQRAVSLATGEVGVAAGRAETARNLDPQLAALGLAGPFSGLTGSVLADSVTANSNKLSNAFAALAGGGQGAAQSIGDFAVLQQLLRSRSGGGGPAAPNGSGDPTANADLSWLGSGPWSQGQQ